MQKQNKTTGAFLAVLLAGMSYGCLSTIVKYAYRDGLNAEIVSGTQVYFGFIFFAVLFLFHKLNKKDKAPWSIRNQLLAFFGGGLITLTSVFYYVALQYVSTALGIVLMFQFVWISPLLALVTGKAKISGKEYIAMGITIAGTLLAAGVFEKSVSHDPVGVVFGLLAALTYAGYLFINDLLNKEVTPIRKSLVVMMGATFLCLFIYPPSFSWFIEYPVTVWQYGIPLTILGTIIPPFLLAYGIPKIGIVISSVVTAIELPVVIVLSIFVLKDGVSWLQFIGVFLIIVAIFFPKMHVLLSKRRSSVE